MIKTATKKIFIINAIIFVLILAAGIFAVFYIKSLDQKAIEISSSIKSLEGDNLASLRSEIRDLENKKSLFDSVYINRDEIVYFVSEIESYASQRGLSLETQKIDVFDFDAKGKEVETQDDRIYSILKVLFKVDGSWSSLIDLLLFMEEHPKNIYINGLRISSVLDADGRANWSFLFDIEALTN